MAKLRRPRPVDGSSLDYAVHHVSEICQTAGSRTMLNNRDRVSGLLRRALASHDTPALFDWLMDVISLQGISDQVAAGYIEQHGNATWRDISQGLTHQPACKKLVNHWHFAECRYNKSALSCSEPGQIAACPLPMFNLRNGRLNQTAFSLYFFIRDIADGDLVAWLDNRIQAAPAGSDLDPFAPHRAAIIEPLCEIYGVSDKVLSMALSTLLLAAPRSLRSWVEIGASMIAVDSLVHNFLHRSGILRRFRSDHLYGARCYQPNGCADALRAISSKIDARGFSSRYPSNFPRFVQHSLWSFCALDGFSVCNGLKIKDKSRCINTECFIYSRCDRIVLKLAL